MPSHVSIITGGGSGIGQATALLLASHGHDVVICGRDASKLQDTIALWKKQSRADRKIVAMSADVSDCDMAQSLIDRVYTRFGRVDVLINNAAALLVQPIEQVAAHAMHEVFAANVFGPATLIARCWPLFKNQGGGRIVNVSSMATIQPFPGLGVYAASKAALESLTRSIHVEGHALGIRSFNVVPGAVETQMLRRVVTADDLPTSQTLEPMDVARVIAECATGLRDDESGGSIVLPNPS